MTPVISPNRFAIYIFSNKNRQITVVQLCNSETFVCEKCQCVHYDCALPLLVQNTDARLTVNCQRNICNLLATVLKWMSSVNYFARIFAAGGTQEFLSFVYCKVASSSLSQLVAYFWVYSRNLMLMYCDLWPKEFKIV